MAELGRERARELGREIDLRVGDAEHLDIADESFDTVICTYGLCTIPDDRSAVREAKRVLRPGGRLLLAEHVRSPNPIVRTIQRVIDPWRTASAATTCFVSHWSIWIGKASRSSN
jgi:ubiquinone/menaquinone biosynthesis C-methylase UbiE